MTSIDTRQKEALLQALEARAQAKGREAARKKEEKARRRAENRLKASLTSSAYLSYSRELEKQHQNNALNFFVELVENEIGKPLLTQFLAEASMAGLQYVEDNIQEIEARYMSKRKIKLAKDMRHLFRHHCLAEKRKRFYEKHDEAWGA
jgi:hypothetical protein